MDDLILEKNLKETLNKKSEEIGRLPGRPEDPYKSF